MAHLSGSMMRSCPTVRCRSHQMLRTPAVKAPAQRRTAKLIVRAGIFDFLTKQTTGPASERQKELLGELGEIVASTGVRASEEAQQEIEQLVEQLQRFSVKNPVKSPLLWGEYEVVYTSKPSASGGPFLSTSGTTIYPAPKARQILEEPNKLTNVVEFATFGFLTGYSKQSGEIKPISGDTFLLTIDSGEIKSGVGGAQSKELNIQREVQIVYLDEVLRIARYLPVEGQSGEDEDEESSGGEEESLFVFKRAGVELEAAEQEDSDDEEPEEKPAPRSVAAFGTKLLQVGKRKAAEASEEAAAAPPARMGTRVLSLGRRQPVEGLATKAERESSAGDSREARARAAEEARVQKQRESEAKAKAAAEARERAEAEREAARARQAEIKELLAQLSADVKEASNNARDAARELATVKKENAPALRDVLQARAAIEAAERETQSAASEIAELAEERKTAEQRLRQAQAALKDAEKSFRQKLLSVRK